MAWQTGQPQMPVLRDLAALVARLIRLSAYQKMARGEAQLRAAGLPADFASVYKKHIQRQVQTTIGTKVSDVLCVKSSSGSTF